MSRTLPWLALIFGIVFCTFSWNYVSFPYDLSNTIVGQYSLNKVNPLNDTLRGLSFIFIPLFLYFITFLKLNNHLLNFNTSQYNFSIPNRNINYLSLILILLSILEFYSLDYKNFISNLDVHHEGTFLTAQSNLFFKNKFWTGTFYDYGFLGNSIGIFSKSVFGEYSIGIQRFTFVFLILINKILIILICKKIVGSLDNSNPKELLFLVFSLSSLTLASFYEDITPFHPRIFIYLIFTWLIFNIISLDKNNLITSLAIGSLSLLSILLYWDIGTYINILLGIFLINLFFFKKRKVFFQVLLGMISSWLIFIIVMPSNEIKEFINQYIFIINISDYLIGIEFPKPFSDKSTRHTKALLLIILSGVFLINYIFDKRKNESIHSKFLLTFLFISSIIFFKSGLTRSDGPHIKYTSGIYTILIFFFISYYFTNYLIKFSFLKKIFNLFKKKNYFLIFSILICLVFFFRVNYLNLYNLFNMNKNFQGITKIDDFKFLSNDYLKFINFYGNLVKNEKCVQQFTDDNAIPYLLNKPTCTKYYVHAHIIQNWTEDDFLRELDNTRPQYILYSSEVNWFKSRNNAPKADKYILDNYFLFKDLSPWIIYKRN
tara:strand:+ start:2532 stop:4337 length:1806 start_codon:yes stop_codon:yes gene_type:complete